MHRRFYPQRNVCHASMEQAAAEWRYDQRHKARPYHDGTFPDDLRLWSAERDEDHPYHARDGVRFWVSNTNVTPHDHFLGGTADCDNPACQAQAAAELELVDGTEVEVDDSEEEVAGGHTS